MRVLRSGLVALGIVTASAVVGVAPAAADLARVPPPVPEGCNFNQAPGVLTCTVASSQTVHEGPFMTPGFGFVPTSTVFGDFTGQQICTVLAHPSATEIQMFGVFVTGVVTTTTTTQRHGLDGLIFATSSSASSQITDLVDGPPPSACTP